MDAVLLVDRHLIFLEIEIGDSLLQHTNQQIVRELVLVGKARCGIASIRFRNSSSVLCRWKMAAREYSPSLSLYR